MQGFLSALADVGLVGLQVLLFATVLRLSYLTNKIFLSVESNSFYVAYPFWVILYFCLFCLVLGPLGLVR